MTDAERWSNVLGREAGSLQEKIRWLDRELELIEAEAEASFADKNPTPKALNAKMRSTIIRWWRHERKKIRPAEQPFSAEAAVEASSPEARQMLDGLVAKHGGEIQ